MLTTDKNSRKIGRKTQYLRQNMKWWTLLLISEIPLEETQYLRQNMKWWTLLLISEIPLQF